MRRPGCVCGCKRRVAHRHHVFYRQHIPASLVQDDRNLVAVAFYCHEGHHSRVSPFLLGVLPDSAFAFGVEVLGAGPAYEYLRRRYAGEDSRLDALLAA